LIKSIKLLTLVYTEGAPWDPQGVNPQETIPMTVSSWASGPPLSPEQAPVPPERGPVQTFDSAESGFSSPGSRSASIAALQSK
jgi:hypothetical protein